MKRKQNYHLEIVDVFFGKKNIKHLELLADVDKLKKKEMYLQQKSENSKYVGKP